MDGDLQSTRHSNSLVDLMASYCLRLDFRKYRVAILPVSSEQKCPMQGNFPAHDRQWETWSFISNCRDGEVLQLTEIVSKMTEVSYRGLPTLFSHTHPVQRLLVFQVTWMAMINRTGAILPSQQRWSEAGDELSRYLSQVQNTRLLPRRWESSCEGASDGVNGFYPLQVTASFSSALICQVAVCGKAITLFPSVHDLNTFRSKSLKMRERNEEKPSMLTEIEWDSLVNGTSSPFTITRHFNLATLARMVMVNEGVHYFCDGSVATFFGTSEGEAISLKHIDCWTPRSWWSKWSISKSYVWYSKYLPITNRAGFSKILVPG